MGARAPSATAEGLEGEGGGMKVRGHALGEGEAVADACVWTAEEREEVAPHAGHARDRLRWAQPAVGPVKITYIRVSTAQDVLPTISSTYLNSSASSPHIVLDVWRVRMGTMKR